MRHFINYRMHVWKIKAIGKLLLVYLQTIIYCYYFFKRS